MGFWSWAKSKFKKKETVTKTDVSASTLKSTPSPKGSSEVGKLKTTVRSSGGSSGGSSKKTIPTDANDIIGGNWYAGDSESVPLTPSQEQDIIKNKDVETVVRSGGGSGRKRTITPQEPINNTSQITPKGAPIPEANKLEPNSLGTTTQDLPVMSDDSGRTTAQKPYDIRTETSWKEKAKATVYDYTIGLPNLFKGSLQMAFGAGDKQGIDPFGAIGNLFSPLGRWEIERRGKDMKPVSPYVFNNKFTDMMGVSTTSDTGFKSTPVDEQSIANPDLLLPPNVAYQKDYKEKVQSTAEDLKPAYTARADVITENYQYAIDTGSMTYKEAQTGYKTDIANLNAEYQKDIMKNANLSPKDSTRYQDSIKFREDYGEQFTDRSLAPSTLVTTGLLVGGSLVGGLPAVAVNTVISAQGASMTVDPTSTTTEKLLGGAMFVTGTYGAMKISGNMITQQRIQDLSMKKGTTTFSRTSFDKYNFQDDFSGTARIGNSKITRFGSAKYKYNPQTKVYSVSGGQSSKITLTDYWTSKPLTVGNYQTFYGVGEQVGSGTITGNYWGGSVKNPVAGSPSRVKEVLTRVEFDTQYTYTNLGGKESIKFGGPSGGQTYQAFVISNKAGRVLSVSGSADDLYMGVSSTKQLQQFTTSSGAKFTVQTSSYSKFPQSSVGTMDSPSLGFIGESDDLLKWRASNPMTTKPSAKIINFEPFPSNAGLSTRYYRGTEMLQQQQVPSAFNQPQTSQGIVIQPQTSSPTILQQTPSTMLSTVPSFSTGGSFATIAPTINIANTLLPTQSKDLARVDQTPISIGSLLPSFLTDTGLRTPQNVIPSTSSASKVGTTTLTEQALVPAGITATVGAVGAGIIGSGGLGFWFPPFGLGAPRLTSGSRKVPAKQTFKYTPDYTSLITGRTGKKGKSIFGTERYAGFETRPITNNWSKMFTNAFGIKKKKKKKGGRK